MFGEASAHGIEVVKQIILEYEGISGQRVNFDKSLIFFSSNVPSSSQVYLGSSMGVRISLNPESYLGLPTMIGRQKKNAFVKIKDRLIQSIEHWSIRFLSMGGKEVDGNDSSVQRTHGCFFSHLWKISLPSKIKISIWRFFHNYLPTFSNLQERRISINSCCPLCCQGPDSVHHIIKERSFSSQIFYRLKLNLTASSTISNWKEWLSQVLMVLSVHDRKLFFIALWAIWGHRNKLIHENCPNNLNSLLSSILSFAKEVDLVLSPSKVQSTTEESSWSPPPVGAVKANFDAAFNKEANCSFSGVIIRNHDGNMMAACSVFNSFIADPVLRRLKRVNKL
ncbi:hypothetical protein V6N13_097687 [Hibiscus sabdariffa]